MPTGSIHVVEPDDLDSIADVARLHLELLGHGPMARLGEHFLRRFCYTVLPQSGLLKVAIYRVDGEPAGFISYTEKSISFHRSAVADHLPAVASSLLLSILRQPKTLLAIPKAIWLMRDRREEIAMGEEPLGEVVSIGVLPQYLRPKFVRESGIIAGEEMVRHAAQALRKLGADRMRMIVEESNKPALFFYSRLGARLESYHQMGEPMVHVWFDLQKDLLDDEA